LPDDLTFYELAYRTEWTQNWVRDLLLVSENLKFREVCRTINRECKYDRMSLRILDYGCGRGRLASLLQKYGTVTGLDFSREAIEQAKQRVPKGTFFMKDVLDRAWVTTHQNQFDVVVNSELIEHLDWECQDVLLENMKMLLTDQGIAILTSPLRERVLELKRSCDQSDDDFLKKFEGQPTANLLTKSELLELGSKYFAVVSVQEVSPLIKIRLLDLFLKTISLPFRYALLEVLTHQLQLKGKFAVICLRKDL